MRRRIRGVVDVVRVLLASVTPALTERTDLLNAHIDAWRAGIESVPMPEILPPSTTHKEGKTSDRQVR